MASFKTLFDQSPSTVECICMWHRGKSNQASFEGIVGRAPLGEPLIAEELPSKCTGSNPPIVAYSALVWHLRLGQCGLTWAAE